MIKINVISTNDIINEIKIIGHANYDVYGKDIVCASVSSIAITSINGILSIYPSSIRYIQNDDQLVITVMQSNDIINKLLNNMVNLLMELANDYSDYIKIN